MRKSCNLDKTLAFATAVAARGTCVGATMAQARAQQGNFGAVQDTTAPRGSGASQLKYESHQKKYVLPETRGGGVQPTSPAYSGITISAKSRVGAKQYKDGTGAIQARQLTGGTKGELVPAVKQ